MNKSFTEKVYEVIKKIPKGGVLTYKEVARRAGSPRAFRAVGTILSKNHNLAIPCHRVLRSDGGIGGYNGGILKKKALLKKEGFVYTKYMKKGSTSTRRRQDGFTLIELLVAVAIIIILASIVYANIGQAPQKARDAVRIRDAQLLAKIIDAYYVENYSLPVPPPDLKNIDSEDAQWSNFWKNLGQNNVLYPPKDGEIEKNGLYRYESELNTTRSVIPAIYVTLERYKETSTPDCAVDVVKGSSNCSDLKKGCLMDSTDDGFGSTASKTKIFVCIPVGPNAN